MDKVAHPDNKTLFSVKAGQVGKDEKERKKRKKERKHLLSHEKIWR